uniref:ABC transporter ATP-binding protein n=1 Tax=Pararhizobium sp. IMCC3301 TaxID=3067904 RepID=UPI0027424215|nr:sn-glycerol-3-phosphate ABC transporter ATP-binding protein UgpC [Pararhizobium sp. IMCC3301]
MATVSIKNLEKTYGKTKVLHGISLDVADGEFVVLVGPSGCGKSTTLRMIAGLEDITAGEVYIGGELVNNREPKERNIAMVFQNYAIYPHMSVRKNIGFGLRTSKVSKPQKEARIAEVAQILGMTELLDRRPNELSGGQRQRVAIGRAMVRDPAAFLFDEPLSNLDAQLRTQMRLEIKKLHQRVGNTIIFVTHDQVEAMTMADRIVIMKDGHIQQIGTPFDVFHRPANMFVAQFIGAPSMNMMQGNLQHSVVHLEGGWQVPVAAGSQQAGPVTLGLRPDDLRVSEEDGQFEGQVSILEPLGSETLVYVSIGKQELIARASGRTPPKLGATVKLSAEPDNMHLFDTLTGNALR